MDGRDGRESLLQRPGPLSDLSPEEAVALVFQAVVGNCEGVCQSVYSHERFCRGRFCKAGLMSGLIVRRRVR